LLQTPAVVFCAIDSIVPIRGKMLSGFDEFSAALEHAGIPLIWVTRRTRLQIDEPRRRIAHTHPFIAEGGCGSYLPEGYFHLRPEKTVRLGRFTCIPAADPQPAAAEALEDLSEQSAIPVVPLRSLAPRELAQNSGLPAHEAELLRQRDFDELFFFAGATDEDVQRFLELGAQKKCQLHPDRPFWSLAIGASVPQCVRALSKLYARALRYQPKLVAIAKENDLSELDRACDRGFILTSAESESSSGTPKTKSSFRAVSLHSPGFWDEILESIAGRR
jgi:predicted mannosyl-3-phosphoglycerate phosphatase (HAD superfamily)